MKNIVIFTIAAVILFTLFWYVRHPLGKKAVINGHTIRLELAITVAEKVKGLGGRDTLASDAGMLFVYQNTDRYGFWMQGMRFPLDFIWIDGNTIVDLSEHIPVPAGGRPVELAPMVPVDKVLEVNAGVIDALNVRIGDSVQFEN